MIKTSNKLKDKNYPESKSELTESFRLELKDINKHEIKTTSKIIVLSNNSPQK